MITPVEDLLISGTTPCKRCLHLGACLAIHGVENVVPVIDDRSPGIGAASADRDAVPLRFEWTAAKSGRGMVVATTFERTAAQNRIVARLGRSEPVRWDPACLAELADENRGLSEGENRRTGAGSLRYAPACGEGFHAAVRSVVEAFASGGDREDHVNVLPGLVSPADVSFLKQVFADFGLAATVLPDGSQTLADPDWRRGGAMLPGGTPLSAVRGMGRARATVDLGAPRAPEFSSAEWLESRFGVPRRPAVLPIGATLSDAFFELLEKLAGRPTPDHYQRERERLLDFIVAGYDRLLDNRVILYGEQDLVVGLAGLLVDAGMLPVLVASPDRTGRLRESLAAIEPEWAGHAAVLEGVDIADLEYHALRLKPDLLVANGRGSGLASRLGVPLVRAGFPLYDQPGGPRILHLGYAGALGILERIAKAR